MHCALQEVSLRRGSEEFYIALEDRGAALSVRICRAAGAPAAHITILHAGERAWPALLEALVAQKLADGYALARHCVGARAPGRPASAPGCSASRGDAPSLASSATAYGGAPVSAARAAAAAAAAACRARKGGTPIAALAPHFHKPINDAARALGICPTVLKKICRRHGLGRWPHRKLASIERALERVEAQARSAAGDAPAAGALESRARGLRAERARLLFEPETGSRV